MSIAAWLQNKTLIVAAENVSHYKSEELNEEISIKEKAYTLFSKLFLCESI